MLTLLIAWSYCLLLSFVFGHLLLTVLLGFGLNRHAEPYHPSLIVLSGWMLLTTLASVWYFFAPINLTFQIILLVIAAWHAWKHREAFVKKLVYYRHEVSRAHWSVKALFAVALLGALLLSVGEPAYYDDGLYYRQFIRWLNEYAIVPGLGNLHPRLAFNSNWHVLQAVFSFSYLPGGGLMDMNGLLHLVVAVYGLEGMRRLFLGDYRLSVVLRSLFMLPTHFFVFFLTAPSADAAVVYGAWMVMVLFLEKTEERALSWFDLKSALIFMLTAFVITAKLTVAPLAILPLIVLVHTLRKGERMHFLMLIVAGLFVSLPWLARNIILSGYVFFPFYQLDILNVDWKVPTAMAREESSYIRAFAVNPLKPYIEVLQMSFGTWFPEWISRLRFFHKVLFLVIFTATPVMVGYMAIQLFQGGKQYLKQNLGYVATLGTCLAGLAVWFITAPDPRFGYAFSIAMYLAVLTLGIRWLLRSPWKRYVPLAVAGLVMLFYLRPVQLAISSNYYTLKSLPDKGLVKPAPYPEFDPNYSLTAEGWKLFGPVSNDQCWNQDLPCTPFTHMGLTLRNPNKGLQGGFVLKNPDLLHYRAMQLRYQRTPDSPEGMEYLKTSQ